MACVSFSPTSKHFSPVPPFNIMLDYLKAAYQNYVYALFAQVGFAAGC